MRAYFFGNMYLSSIQQGIQAAHVTHELFRKYKVASKQFDVLANWADLHKTMILLNGGYADNLRTLIDMFNNTQNPYPFTWFNEGEDSLDGALTCVGIVLPEKIYETASMIRRTPELGDDIQKYGSCAGEFGPLEFSKFEFELMLELNKYGLAS